MRAHAPVRVDVHVHVRTRNVRTYTTMRAQADGTAGHTLMRMRIGVGTWFIRPFPMAAEELELSEKKKVEEAVRLLRSVTGKSGPTSASCLPPTTQPSIGAIPQHMETPPSAY